MKLNITIFRISSRSTFNKKIRSRTQLTCQFICYWYVIFYSLFRYFPNSEYFPRLGFFKHLYSAPSLKLNKAGLSVTSTNTREKILHYILQSWSFKFLTLMDVITVTGDVKACNLDVSEKTVLSIFRAL